MPTIRRIMLIAGLAVLVLSLPQSALAISGCTNGYIVGTYNGQIDNINLLNAVNVSSTAGTVGSSTGTATAPKFPTGFANNMNSLTSGGARYYFDGNGNIFGQAANAGGNTNLMVGAYTVNDNCTVSIKFNGGQTYNAVLVSGGGQILFLESDANGEGALGTLERSPNSCGAIYAGASQSFGFSFYGQSPAAAAMGGGSLTTAMAQPYSAIGTLNLDGQGNFTMSEWVSSAGVVTSQNASGGYTVGGDCSLALTFNQSGGASTAPMPAVAGTIDVGGRGLLLVTVSGSTYTGKISTMGSPQVQVQ